MSRLSDLLAHVRKSDPQAAEALEREISARENGQRKFGLVFERHMPEAVELHSVKVRRGSTVHVLPPRSSNPKKPDLTLWRVEQIEHGAEGEMAHLVSLDPRPQGTEAQRWSVALERLIYVAPFTEPIYPGLIETGGGTERP